jgi:hypothetical protein
MTQALEAVIAVPAKLPPDEQDALSALLVAEMDSEERWSDLFSQSQGPRPFKWCKTPGPNALIRG